MPKTRMYSGRFEKQHVPQVKQSVGIGGKAGMLGGIYESHASGRTRTAAIDAGFIAVLHRIGTSRHNAESGLANAALAIIWRRANLIGGAFRAVASTAIDVRFFAIQDAIGATRRRTYSTHAGTAGALRVLRTSFSVRTRKATNTAINIAFARILHVVGTLGIDAPVHHTSEVARTTLDSIEARDAEACAIANAARAVDFGAQCAFGDWIVGKNAVIAHIGRAFFRVVVEVICGNVDDIERVVTLFFETIAVELRRQWCTGSLQSFAPAFAI